MFAGTDVVEPTQAAALVVEGIQNDRYLLLTHDSSRAQIETRLDAIRADLGETA